MLGTAIPTPKGGTARPRDNPVRGMRNEGEFQSSSASLPHSLPFLSVFPWSLFCFFLYLLFSLPPQVSVLVSLYFPLCL